MFLSHLLSFETKTRILLFLQKFKNNDFFKPQLTSSKNKAFIFLAADYGNLGDVAITYAQTQFLKNTLPDFEIVDVPISKTLEGITAIKKSIQKNDIITTVGGGNFGDLYDQIELYRQLVFENFPNNKALSFPQTIDFSETISGQKALKTACNRYSKHPNLTFIAREEISFQKMKTELPKNTIILTPDIVMSLDQSTPSYEREGVVLCLRNDDEKLLTKTNQDDLEQLIKLYFSTVTNYDTHINKNNLSLADREYQLDKIWTIFKKAELVVTDRLHGMIFCYITNTPCLVFQNNNHKVKGCYAWIKDKSSILLLENFSVNQVKELLEKKIYFNKWQLLPENEFADLIKQIRL